MSLQYLSDMQQEEARKKNQSLVEQRRHDYDLICMVFRVLEHQYDWIKKHLHGVELIGLVCDK